MNIEQLNQQDKIINLLNLINKSNSQVYLRVELNEFDGIIKEVQNEYFIFTTKFKVPLIPKLARLHFNYLNKYYYFESKLIKYEKNLFYFKIPITIFCHSRRKARRYNIENLNIFSDIKIIHLPDSPALKVNEKQFNLSYEKNKIIKELSKDLPDTNFLITLIIKEVKEYFIFDEVKFIIPPKKEDLIAKILNRWQKPLLISKTDIIDEYLNIVNDKNFFTYGEYIKFLRDNKIEESRIAKFIENNIKLYKKMNIYSILYVPIFVSNIMVGYIMGYNKFERKKIINKNDIEYLIQAAAIIHSSILKRRLNSLNEGELKIKVFDISTEGTGLKILDPFIAKLIEKDFKLRLTIKIEKDKIISFIGSVKSKRELANSTLIGIEIYEIDEKSRITLYNFISNLSKPD